jgi:hypothetical protein
MRVKLISLVAIFRKELFSSGVERPSSRAIVQPIEMIGCREHGWCVRGLKCSGETLKTGWTSLGCDSMATDEDVVRATSQDRKNEGDTKCRPPWDTNPHARFSSAVVFRELNCDVAASEIVLRFKRIRSTSLVLRDYPVSPHPLAIGPVLYGGGSCFRTGPDSRSFLGFPNY